MKWDLADYPRHPVDGDPAQVAALATHLGGVVSDIRSQLTRIQQVQAGDFWESSAGSADTFQEVAEKLPEKLDLVAKRYENVAAALDVYHPVMAQTQQDAEHWIQEAESAEAEIERAEAGVAEMEAFEAQAESAAEFTNENREPDEPEVQAEAWPYEDYRSTLVQAQQDFDTAIANCRAAVEDFATAHDACAEAIYEAGNDDLKNDDSLWGSFTSWAGDMWDAAMDFLDVFVEILQVIGAVLAIVALFVPGLNLIVAAIAVAVLLGTVLLYFDGRRTGWDVAAAALGAVTAGVGAASQVAGTATRAGQILQHTDRALTVADGFIDIDSDGISMDWQGGLLAAGAVGLDYGVTDRFDLLGSDGGIPILQYGDELFGGGLQLPGNAEFTDVLGSVGAAGDFGEMLRPQSDQSGLPSFDGLDVAVSPADMEVPQITLPELGPIDIPPMEPIEVPQIILDVNVPVSA